jgi:hypothetical protein
LQGLLDLEKLVLDFLQELLVPEALIRDFLEIQRDDHDEAEREDQDDHAA